MKYLIIIFLLISCSPKVTSPPDPEYGEADVRHSGDTIFWKGIELGFLLTQEETKDWVVMRMEKTYDRYSLWKKINCDSAAKLWNRYVNKTGTCVVFESVISNERYNLRGVQMEYVLQPEYGEKYVREINH